MPDEERRREEIYQRNRELAQKIIDAYPAAMAAIAAHCHPLWYRRLWAAASEVWRDVTGNGR